MASDNEDVKNEGSPDDSKKGETSKHHSWFDNLIDRAQDMDTDFPLSGGEEDPRPPRHTEPEKEDATGEENKEPDTSKHYKSILGDIIDDIERGISHLDTDFPLSGGEE